MTVTLDLFLAVYPYIVLGVLFSALLPMLRKALPTPPANTRYAGVPLGERFWPIAKPYVIIFVISLIIGVLVVVFAADTLKDDWIVSFTAGFTWDSIIQKVTTT